MSNLFRSKSYKSYFAESHPSKADRLYLLDSQSDATLTDTLSISHSNQHTESDTHSNTQSDTDSNRVSPQPNYTTTRGPPNACLFVASLCSAKSESELSITVTNYFSQWGTLLHVKVLKDWKSRPFAFVQFKNVKDAEQALVEANNTFLDNRPIRIERAKVNRTLFISKIGFLSSIINLLDRELSEIHIHEILSKFGSIETLKVLKDFETGIPKGCVFVKYCFREDAIVASIQLQIHQNWIFIGQIDPQVTESMVRERFQSYGDITHISLICKHHFHGYPPRPSFAFVTYESPERLNQM
ncbi:hypothetical protein BC833DRAFT_562613 [Globomyces pollinis-pini]|nr:hypothetical protein BC833DRAFT_562613 [Globomyces pollinis-pini]